MLKLLGALFLNLLCLINKHYGDVVFDVVEKFAGITDEAVSCFFQPEVAFTFGTGEDVK